MLIFYSFKNLNLWNKNEIIGTRETLSGERKWKKDKEASKYSQDKLDQVLDNLVTVVYKK